jgi:hypothetical protein
MGSKPAGNLGMVNLQNEQQTIVIKGANHHFNALLIYLSCLTHHHSYKAGREGQSTKVLTFGSKSAV